MTVAKRRAIDTARRGTLLDRKHEQLARELDADTHATMANRDLPGHDESGDDLLSLVFVCCHPVLSSDARVALTLRLLGGLTTEEIARAFLVPEPTVAQRIVRAKRALAAAHVSFEAPTAAERTERSRQSSR
jgi:predicted RNA polymerase sigma factor